MNSTTLNTFNLAVRGWGHTSEMRFFKRQEDAALQGFNRMKTLVSQICQFILLSEQVAILEDINKTTYLPTLTRIISLIAIPLIGMWLHFSDSTDQNLKRRINLLHVNTGYLLQIINVIATLALLQAGYDTYASFSLASLAIEILAHKKILPSQMRYAYLKIHPYAVAITTLFSMSWLVKGLLMTKIASAIKDFMRKPTIPYDKSEHISCLKNYQQFEEILNGKSQLEINRDHVRIIPFPETSVKTFTSLIQLCNDFNWKNPSTLNALTTSLENDPRWGEFIESEDVQQQLKKDTAAVQINYLKTKFETLVNSVENESIETGEPLDYGILRQYLGYITEYLPLAPLEEQQRIMIELAVEGGDYCGPGIYNQLEIAATALLQGGNRSTKKTGLPLKQRFLLILQQERLRTIQGYHILSEKILPGYFKILGGLGDVHSFNYTVKLLGEDFGLPDQGARQDTLSPVNTIERLFFGTVLGFSSNDLWRDVSISKMTLGEVRVHKCRGYTPNRVLEAIKTQIGIPLISNLDIYTWAANWINNLKVSPEVKASFLEKLEDGESFENNLQFKEGFINAILVDMGILTVKTVEPLT